MHGATVRYIAIYDLSEPNMPAVGHEVKNLRLDRCLVKSSPFQVVPGNLGVGRGFGNFGN